MVRLDLGLAAAIFVCVFLVHALSPNATPFDSRWTVYTAVSILRQGNVDLNEFEPALLRDDFYAIECVQPGGERTYPLPPAAGCPGGRYYNFYPVAVALMAAPVVFALEQALLIAQPVLRPFVAALPAGYRRSFLEGDLPNSAMATELTVASFLIALTTIVIYGIARAFLPPLWSLLPAFVFAFCTPAWSTGSRALWQHGPGMLLLALALWIAVSAEKRPHWIRYLGMPLMLAFFVRPTYVIPLICFTGYVFQRHQRFVPAYLGGMIPIALLFTAISLQTYGTFLAPYAFASRPNAPSLAIHSEMLAALAGNLFSPARGLLVYVPLFFLCIPGMLRPPNRVLQPWLTAAVVLHWLLISSYEYWWGGHSFGPRYFADLIPLLVYFLIPAIAAIRTVGSFRLTAAFGILTAMSCFIHYRGATQWATMEWNMAPENIRANPGRIWDWRDPQFLRGLRR